MPDFSKKGLADLLQQLGEFAAKAPEHPLALDAKRGEPYALGVVSGVGLVALLLPVLVCRCLCGGRKGAAPKTSNGKKGGKMALPGSAEATGSASPPSSKKKGKAKAAEPAPEEPAKNGKKQDAAGDQESKKAEKARKKELNRKAQEQTVKNLEEKGQKKTFESKMEQEKRKKEEQKHKEMFDKAQQKHSRKEEAPVQTNSRFAAFGSDSD